MGIRTQEIIVAFKYSISRNRKGQTEKRPFMLLSRNNQTQSYTPAATEDQTISRYFLPNCPTRCVHFEPSSCPFIYHPFGPGLLNITVTGILEIITVLDCGKTALHQTQNEYPCCTNKKPAKIAPHDIFSPDCFFIAIGPCRFEDVLPKVLLSGCCAKQVYRLTGLFIQVNFHKLSREF